MNGGFHDVVSRYREILRQKFHARQHNLDALFKKKFGSYSEGGPQQGRSCSTQSYPLYIAYIFWVILNKVTILTIFGHPK
jgi:hypothetical protein